MISMSSPAPPDHRARRTQGRTKGSRAILSEDERRPASEGSGHPCSWKRGGCQQTDDEA